MTSESLQLRLIPDWQTPASLVLVWPEFTSEHIREKYRYVPGYEKNKISVPAASSPEVRENYTALISSTPSKIPLTLVVTNPYIKPRSGKNYKLHDYKGKKNHIMFREINDIWLRDFMPVLAFDPRNKLYGIKARYRPRYLPAKEANEQHGAGLSLCANLKIPCVEFPLVWDLGNLTHNGEGIAIVTKRILSDNPGIQPKEIHRIYCKVMGVTKLIIIDEDPEDATGHVDGMVRFLGPKIIAVAKYPDTCRELNMFMDKIKKQIRQQLGSGYKIIEIMNSLLIDEDDGEVGNAFGNHMNFLRLGPDVLMLPVYNITTDEMAENTLRKALPDCRIIPVEASALSMAGGVLNCISWVRY